MLNFLRKKIRPRHPIRLWYHKINAILAAIWYRFPSNRLQIIAITGTSGKSTTVELVHFLIQSAGQKCGAISTVQFHFGDKTEENTTLRTSLRPWKLQKMLRRMVRENCKYAVIEVSSHAIDQHRLWGVNIDTAICTNCLDNEHLDYHRTFIDYRATKSRIFDKLNHSPRKPGIPKVSILNRDDAEFDFFSKFSADKKWTFSRKKPSDFHANGVRFSPKKIEFLLKIPNQSAEISVPMIGAHNLENILVAIAVAVSLGIRLEVVARELRDFPGVPGRLELVRCGQKFPVVVDFSYKPSALRAVCTTLKKIISGKLIVVFGGAGGRSLENLAECGAILHKFADEIVLTTDDPYFDDPRQIATAIRKSISRDEGAGFFEIKDRYEAIRYAIFTAEPEDIVLVAGRGHEKTQTIGRNKIQFDDREVCREILSFSADRDLIL